VVDPDEPPFSHVGEQDADHAEGKIHTGGEVGHRGREAAQTQQGKVLGLEIIGVRVCSAYGGDHRHQVEGLLAGRPGPAAGQRVGTDDRAGFMVKPPVVCWGHARSLRLCYVADGPGGDGEMLPDPLDENRHFVGDEAHVGGRGCQDREA
jgi:hypothetical protein